jgi:hypothetical protein
MRTWKASTGIVLAGVLLATSTACEDHGPTGPGGSVPFANLYETPYSGIFRARAEVIRDEARWASVWSEIHARQSFVPPLPPVDFERDMLVLVGIGEKTDGCWSVEILELRSGSGQIHVRAEDRHRTGCFCTQALTQPVQVVRAVRTEGNAAGEIVSRNVSCQ